MAKKKTTKSNAATAKPVEAATPVVDDIITETKPEEQKTPVPVQPKPVRECFEILGEKYRRYVLPSDDIVDFRFGVPSNAPELYLSGFPYLGLLPGAEYWLKNTNKSEIAKAISWRRSADVKILKNLLK